MFEKRFFFNAKDHNLQFHLLSFLKNTHKKRKIVEEIFFFYCKRDKHVYIKKKKVFFRKESTKRKYRIYVFFIIIINLFIALITQRTNHSNTSLHPVGRIDISVCFQNKNEVGRVTSCGKRTCTTNCLVKWAVIDASGWFLPVDGGVQPNHWGRLKQHFRARFLQFERVGVDTRAFDVHAIDVATLWGMRLECFVALVRPFETIGNSVDGDLLGTSVVLESTCEEGLREEESGDPVGLGVAVLVPGFNHLETLDQITDPGAKRLHRRISNLTPNSWNLIGKKRLVDNF